MVCLGCMMIKDHLRGMHKLIFTRGICFLELNVNNKERKYV